MLSIPHIIVIFLVTLVVLGPEKLPQIARTMGKIMADFRRVTGDFRYQMENEMREMERQARLKELSASMAATVDNSIAQPLPDTPIAPYETAHESAYEAAHTLSLSEHPVPNEVLDPITEPELTKESASAEPPKPADGQSPNH